MAKKIAKKENPITVNQLAVIIQRAFIEQDKSLNLRFNAIDKRFDAIDKKFDEVDKRFDAVDRRFDEVDKRFDAIENRLDNIENQNKETNYRLTILEHKQDNFQLQLDTKMDKTK